MKITIGYGDFSGYLLTEVPNDSLRNLAEKYPLEAAKHDPSVGEALYITVAIHEELKHRDSGRQAVKHLPTVVELVIQIVARGFRELSKEHHPNKKGDPEAQKQLHEARELLRVEVDKLKAEMEGRCDGIVIMNPVAGSAAPRWRRAPRPYEEDDVPF